MTKGMKSSEFYITLISLVVGSGMALHGIEGGVIAAVLSPCLTYIGGRSAVGAMGKK